MCVMTDLLLDIRLLFESKLRARIEKDLPKITAFLQRQIPLWESHHAIPFLWKGTLSLYPESEPNKANALLTYQVNLIWSVCVRRIVNMKNARRNPRYELICCLYSMSLC